MKTELIALLRQMRLLQFVDYLRYRWVLIRTRQDRESFIARNPDYPLPPLDLAYDAYGHTDWQAYYDSGKEHAGFFGNLIKEYLDNKSVLRIAEWGCGPARVLRHLPSLFKGQSVEFHGFDYNPRTIAWCQRDISGISFHLNSLTPPLECDAASFDCIYSISVLTHLSREMHFQWIAELSRVVKPGGIIIVTTHGDTSRPKLQQNELEKYDQGELVVRGYIEEGKRCFLAYHPTSFMRDQLFKGFEVLSHIPASAHLNLIHQDVWIIRTTVGHKSLQE